MEALDILKKIEDILNTEENPVDTEVAETQASKKHPVKEVVYLILTFLLNILQTPFKVVATFLKNEIIEAMKKDAKLYAVIMGLMGVMFVFFSVLWLFVSIAIGFYFYEKGSSLLEATLYSIGFQVISFMFVAIIALIAGKNIKSIKLIAGISESIKKAE